MFDSLAKDAHSEIVAPGLQAQSSKGETSVSPALLHQFFERKAALYPDRTAVVCGGESLTYDELNGWSDHLADYLRAKGVGPGDCVGLLLPRCVEVYVSLLGILKAGAAYVPLDPEYPADRVGFILGDCGAAALVTSSTLKGRAAGFQNRLLCVDDADLENPASSTMPETDGRNSFGLDAALSRASMGGRRTGGTPPFADSRKADSKSSAAKAEATPGDLAYIIYTSGTTGRPKGVQIEHRSVCHLVRAESEIFQVQPDDRVYQGFSLAFDASVEEVWLAFFAGATLVAATNEMVHAGAALSGMLAEAGVTVLSCVPTLLSMMEEDVPSLRLLILGGEACPPDLVRRWWKPGRRVVNTYGPTEATVIASYAECDPAKSVTIGQNSPRLASNCSAA